jgi:glycerol-1-phosphate dehydrogenase [NAD(P)+]
MTPRTQIGIPTVVRVKPGALDRLGIYLSRQGHRRVVLVVSGGMVPDLVERAERSLVQNGAEAVERVESPDATFEAVAAMLAGLGGDRQAVIGLGGGKALDVAKYLASLAKLPYYAVPTSLSNDGFCSPQSSLTLAGRRRSLTAALPFAVVIDTEVALGAPEPLWWSGVGDLVAKVTAVFDWKLAFHARGEPVDDFAALLSDATVYQFLSHPERSPDGVRRLALALMLNGIAMEVCGSSRPASGSEHLISHALDALCARPRLHGLQVGVASYICSRLQGQGTDLIAGALDRTGFWDGVRADPIPRREWLEAVRTAPAMKPDRFTVLSTRDVVPEVTGMIDEDPRLHGCFAG